MHNRKYKLLLLLIIVAVFLAGIVKLFLLRFESGDIYPPYSSLRADPLGSRALYESYEASGAFSVKRNYISLNKLSGGADTSIFFLGTTPGSGDFVPQNVYERLTDFLASGGRVIVAFSPVKKSYKPEKNNNESEDAGEKEVEDESTEKTVTEAGEKEDDEKNKDQGTYDTDLVTMVSLSEKWGFEYNYEVDDAAKTFEAVTHGNDPDGTISWHSTMSFSALSDAWRVIYRLNEKPVVIERSHGGGRIIFCSDSYVISNEALRNERRADFLSWLAGNVNNIIFDESHLGIRKNPGIATLIKQYQLHRFAGFLALFSLLFIWRNASYFVPPAEGVAIVSENRMSARDSSSGLASLLRKNINKNKVLDVCVSEWGKSFVQDNDASKLNAAHLQKMQFMVNPGNEDSPVIKDPVNGYVRLCRILSEGKKI